MPLKHFTCFCAFVTFSAKKNMPAQFLLFKLHFPAFNFRLGFRRCNFPMLVLLLCSQKAYVPEMYKDSDTEMYKDSDTFMTSSDEPILKFTCYSSPNLIEFLNGCCHSFIYPDIHSSSSRQVHFKVNNRNVRTSCEIFSKLTMKTPEQRQWCRSGISIVNLECISHFFIVFLLLNLSK